MIEILPNFHPIFVHFTVALFSTSVLLFVATRLLGKYLSKSLNEQWAVVARWNLWFSLPATIITVLAGFYAYNTVAHDTPSHAAMTEHRNWAIAVFVLIVLTASWSITRALSNRPLGKFFIGLLLITQTVLLITAWHGGELVYRHGLGVLALPQTEIGGNGHNDGHDHIHATSVDKQDSPNAGPVKPKGNIESHDNQTHPHKNDENHENSQNIEAENQNKPLSKPVEETDHRHSNGDLHKH